MDFSRTGAERGRFMEHSVDLHEMLELVQMLCWRVLCPFAVAYMPCLSLLSSSPVCSIMWTLLFPVSNFFSRLSYGFPWGFAFCHKTAITDQRSLMQAGDRKEGGWNQRAQINARLSASWHSLKPANTNCWMINGNWYLILRTTDLLFVDVCLYVLSMYHIPTDRKGIQQKWRLM